MGNHEHQAFSTPLVSSFLCLPLRCILTYSILRQVRAAQAHGLRVPPEFEEKGAADLLVRYVLA